MSETMRQIDTPPDLQPLGTSADRPLALDYALMRGAMIQWVQALAGDRWTNYNESDPGVTILEHLCFALTELGLRADQPIPALLASTQSLRMQLQRLGLYAAQDILPGPALTLLDQRRWLLDQVPHAANLWLKPRGEGTHGLIQAVVLPRLPDMGACICPPEEDDLKQDLVDDVKRCAARLRNLGEDLDDVVVLSPQALTLAAKVNINSQRHPDEILAEMLFRLGLVLAPEPRRHALDDRIKAGLATAEIYLGPPMQRGFIADDELIPVIKPPVVRELRELMASVTGVLEVEGLSVALEPTLSRDAAQARSEEEQLLLRPGCYPRLQVDLSATPPPLQLYRDSHPVACNPERVQRLLNRWWQDHRQSFNLDQSYLQAFPLPQASSVEDGAYTSIQTLFPSVYGLAAHSSDPSLTPMQQGQIKQLKGYLLIFDQLMADFAAQLAFMRDLFSPLAGGDQTYAYRPLHDVPGCDAGLLISGYDTQQASLHQRLDPKEQRQALILDFFLTIYGQSLLPLAAGSAGASPREAMSASVLQAKQEFLRDVVVLSRERGAGVNYRESDHLAAPTALERRCAMELRVRRPSGEPEAVALETVAEKATFGRLLSAEAARRVRESFLTLDGLMAPLARPDLGDARVNPFAGKTVAAVLWPALSNPKRYRIGGCDVGEDVDLVCLDDSGGCWWLGSFAHARLAHAYAHQLLAMAGAQTDAVYILEWVLLRHALRHPAARGMPADLFNSRVSIVVMREQPSPAQSEMVASLLRPHVPAHLELQVHVYGPRRFTRFVDHREAWLKSLAGEDPDRQASAAHRLVSFLLDGALPSPPSPPTPPTPPTPPVPSTPQSAAPSVAAEQQTAIGSAIPSAPETVMSAGEPAVSPAAPSPDASASGTSGPVATAPALAATPVDLLPPRAPLLLLPPPRISADLALKMIAPPALAEAEGAWCDNPVEVASLRLWRMAGLRFVMRSLPWQASSGGALAEEELSALLRLGFAVMPFQDPSSSFEPASQDPSASAPPAAMEDLGRQHGEAAVQAAQRLRLSRGVVIWLAGSPRTAVADPTSGMLYINAWSQAVMDGGFASGLLMTTATPLTNLRCDWLGRWDGAVPPPMLGFGLIRDSASEKQQLLAGQGDILRIQQDRRGRTPQWLALDPRAMPPSPP
jgi:hypothetical protein